MRLARLGRLGSNCQLSVGGQYSRREDGQCVCVCGPQGNSLRPCRGPGEAVPRQRQSDLAVPPSVHRAHRAPVQVSSVSGDAAPSRSWDT